MLHHRLVRADIEESDRHPELVAVFRPEDHAAGVEVRVLVLRPSGHGPHLEPVVPNAIGASVARARLLSVEGRDEREPVVPALIGPADSVMHAVSGRQHPVLAHRGSGAREVVDAIGEEQNPY